MDVVTQEAVHFRKIQESRWSYFYVLNVAVANNSTFPAVLTIDQDADFLFTSMTGSFYGPTDASGIRQLNASTVFPLAGTAVPSGAGLGAYADRGLMVQMVDSGKTRTLANGFVPVECIFTPGYSLAKTEAQPFKYFALRNSKINFNFFNRDTQSGGLYHFASIVLYGQKYMTQDQV